MRPAVVFVAGLLALSAACSPSPGPGRRVGAEPDPTATPVVLVHGFSSAACPGTDVTRNIWGAATLELARAGWSTAHLVPVSFYTCDTDGVDITGYGADVPSGATAAVTQ